MGRQDNACVKARGMWQCADGGLSRTPQVHRDRKSYASQKSKLMNKKINRKIICVKHRGVLLRSRRNGALNRSRVYNGGEVSSVLFRPCENKFFTREGLFNCYN